MAGLFIALPFFFLFPLARMGFVGAVLICSGLALGIYLALKYVLLWDANVFVLTDRRFVVVMQSGLWNRHVIEAPLSGSQAAVRKRSLFERLFRIGDVAVSGEGLSGPVTVSGLPRPDAAVRMLHGLRDAQNAGFKVRGVT